MTIAALALAAASPAVAGAAPRETKYDVTFEARMTETWKAETHVNKECQVGDPIGRCLEDEVGSGAAKVYLRTPTPQRVSVITGAGGAQPMVTYAIDSGIPVKGEYKRAGTFTDVYSGLWDAANPDTAMPTKDCGSHAVKTDVALMWKGRNALAPLLALPDLFECPTGPHSGFDFTPSTAPSVTEVVAPAAESKFGRAKQFTIRGAQTWTGSVTPINRTEPDDMYSTWGQSEIRWSWEATFRKVGKGRKRRR